MRQMLSRRAWYHRLSIAIILARNCAGRSLRHGMKTAPQITVPVPSCPKVPLGIPAD